MKNNKITLHKDRTEPWEVTLIDTGANTMTGGRLKRVKDYIENDDFSFIEINVRGNPGIYFIHIRTGMTILPWQFYAGKFSVSENWKRIIVKLSDFKKSNFYQPSRFSPSDIKSIAFVAYGRDFDARLDVKSAYLKK